MNQLAYVTGNDVKFRQATIACEPASIELVQTKLDLDEIQAESAEVITKDKSQKAFKLLKGPVVISDDSWMIPGLNGFPGPYMKSMNEWFTVDDWIRLTKDLQDRRIILRQLVAYKDDRLQKLFTKDIEGVLVREPKGNSPYPHCYITSFDGGVHTSAESHEKNESAIQDQDNVWYQFAEWYNEYST